MTAALAANVGNAVAATSINEPMNFKVYADNKKGECKGNPLGRGTITSVTAMGDGKFCENTNQIDDTGEKRTVFTKVDLNSCDATAKMGAVFLDAYVCKDSSCALCTDVDGIPVAATMMLPNFEPLPAADSCWGIEASTTGITVLNQFDPSVGSDLTDKYWQLYFDNSCMKDTVVIDSGSDTGDSSSNPNPVNGPDSSAAIAAPMALVSSIGLMFVASLI